MWSLDFVDEYCLEKCKEQFKRVYPEFPFNVLGVKNDKSALIFECTFPDGTFYFDVTENSVSSGYTSLNAIDNEDSGIEDPEI